MLHSRYADSASRAGSLLGAVLTATRSTHLGKAAGEIVWTKGVALPDGSERRTGDDPSHDVSGRGVAGDGRPAKNPYDIGTQATLVALTHSGVLTRGGKLGKAVR